MRLSRWGFALLGFALTLTLAWAGVTVYTFVKERQSEKRITRVEQFVVGVGPHHRVSSPTARSGGNQEGPNTDLTSPAPESEPAVQGPDTGGGLAPSHPHGTTPSPAAPHHVGGGKAPEPAESAPMGAASPSEGGSESEAPSPSSEESNASEGKPVAEAGHILESASEALTGALCGTTERLQLQRDC